MWHWNCNNKTKETIFNVLNHPELYNIGLFINSLDKKLKKTKPSF